MPLNKETKPIIQLRHTVKEFQVLLFNTNNSIQHNPFVLPRVKWFQVVLCITYNSIKCFLFVCPLLNDQRVLFQTIQFSIRFVCIQFKDQTVLFNPLIVSYQVLPL